MLIEQAAAPTAEQTAAETPITPAAPVTPAPADVKLAEKIRADREARETRAREHAERQDLKSQLDSAKAELERIKAQDDPVKDPVGWAKHRKLSKEEQALVGQSLLYDIVPDKAPADLRVKLLEAKMAREKAEEAETRKREAQEADRRNQELQVTNYATALKTAVTSFESGSFPESEGWFGEDQDTYTRSLLATARNLAEAATNANKVADLSPGNVARVLEADIASRMKRRDERRVVKPKETQTPGNPGEPKAAGSDSTTSTKGLSTGGPRAKAISDKERIQRAIEAGWTKRQ